MPRNVRSARGDVVDFDTIIIKQQLAQAPMNIEVARRKNFIDSKERKGTGQRSPQPSSPAVAVAPLQPEVLPKEPTSASFEPDNGPIPEGKLPPLEAVPVLPVRNK